MKKIIVIALCICCSLHNTVFAQMDNEDDTHTLMIVIPEVALLDIETNEVSKNFTMTFTHPTEAGTKLSNPSSNTTMYLNYSSVKSAADPTRSISVSIGTNVPGGISFFVSAGSVLAGSFGTAGSPTSPISLNTVPDVLIDNIGSCFTGTGANKGHLLTYSATHTVASYGSIVAINTPFTVTYTLSDN